MTPATPPSPEPASVTARVLEMAHVLFMDIVAYSKLPMDKQQQVLGELQEAVRTTATFARAQAEDKLIRLPTGDGMALVFFGDPEFPAHCALELSRALREHPEIKLRMGIHTGPVYRVADINANRNVAGGGINMAQRVMDCGDAGHILVSKVVADVLAQVSTWSKVVLRDLGEAEVKHGVRVHIYNLYTPEAGNSELPQKLQTTRITAATAFFRTRGRKVLLVVMIAALVGGLALAYVRAHTRVPPTAQTNASPAPTQQHTNQVQQQTNQAQQTSTGQGSPNVQGVQGDVTITIDQSAGKTKTQKPPPSKPKQEDK